MAPGAKRSRSSSTKNKTLAKQVRLTDSFRQKKKPISSQSATAKKLQQQSCLEASPPVPSQSLKDEVEGYAGEIDSEGDVDGQELSATPDANVREKQVEEAMPLEPEAEEPLDFEDPEYRAYFDQTQKVNIAAPIHQQGVSTVVRILKNFDLTAAYGPTVGMTRLQRWRRAEKLGLKPPEVVYKILVSKEGKSMDELREGYLYGQI
ncbi:DNA polymerase delta, subunit 4-domain-containing protein [Lipomyces kononenkoae]|uniref:DNA polymerase delta, subunit 4-domain-containing protein n=1 Tax=Lipomyces kononenkoae TaxID=34357 RepID=A0ACC3TAB5_LIPKO